MEVHGANSQEPVQHRSSSDQDATVKVGLQAPALPIRSIGYAKGSARVMGLPTPSTPGRLKQGAGAVIPLSSRAKVELSRHKPTVKRRGTLYKQGADRVIEYRRRFAESRRMSEEAAAQSVRTAPAHGKQRSVVDPSLFKNQPSPIEESPHVSPQDTTPLVESVVKSVREASTKAPSFGDVEQAKMTAGIAVASVVSGVLLGAGAVALVLVGLSTPAGWAALGLGLIILAINLKMNPDLKNEILAATTLSAAITTIGAGVALLCSAAAVAAVSAKAIAQIAWLTIGSEAIFISSALLYQLSKQWTGMVKHSEKEVPQVMSKIAATHATYAASITK